MKSNQAF